MIKLAGLILDPYDDPQFVDSPEVKDAGLPMPEDVAGFRDRDFAIIIKTAARRHRKYPVSTSVLTKLSAAYFNEFGSQLPKDMQESVRYHMKLAADRHGITLDGFASRPVEGPKPHEVVSFGEEVEVQPGLGKEAAFAFAQREFLNNVARMTPAERALAANDLSKVGEVDDSRVFDYVPKDEFGPLLGKGLDQRRTALSGNQEKLAALDDLSRRIEGLGARRGAVILDQFDKLAGIRDRVIDAYRTCWGGFVKVADANGRQFGVGGLSEETYRIETLARAHGDAVRQVFSDDIARAFLRDPIAYYQSADGQVKRTLKALASNVGKRNPKSEIHREQVPSARETIRSGEYTPWSKTCG